MGILQADVVVLDGVASYLQTRFVLHDGHGRTIGRVEPEGGGLRSTLKVKEQLAMVDADGSLVLRTEDVHQLGRDRFEVRDGYDRHLAVVMREHPWWYDVRVTLASGAVLEVQRDHLGEPFTVVGPGGVAAAIEQRRPTTFFRAKRATSYTVRFVPQVPYLEKVGILGAALVQHALKGKGQHL